MQSFSTFTHKQLVAWQQPQNLMWNCESLKAKHITYCHQGTCMCEDKLRQVHTEMVFSVWACSLIGSSHTEEPKQGTHVYEWQTHWIQKNNNNTKLHLAKCRITATVWYWYYFTAYVLQLFFGVINGSSCQFHETQLESLDINMVFVAFLKKRRIKKIFDKMNELF